MKSSYPAVSTAVLSGKDGEEDVPGREDCRNGVDTTGKSFSEEHDVGLDYRVVLEAKELPSPAETLGAGASALAPKSSESRTGAYGLHLVADKEDVVLLAQRLAPLQVIIGGHHNTGKRAAGVSFPRGNER